MIQGGLLDHDPGGRVAVVMQAVGMVLFCRSSLRGMGPPNTSTMGLALCLTAGRLQIAAACGCPSTL